MARAYLEKKKKSFGGGIKPLLGIFGGEPERYRLDLEKQVTDFRIHHPGWDVNSGYENDLSIILPRIGFRIEEVNGRESLETKYIF